MPNSAIQDQSGGGPRAAATLGAINGEGLRCAPPQPERRRVGGGPFGQGTPSPGLFTSEAIEQAHCRARQPSSPDQLGGL